MIPAMSAASRETFAESHEIFACIFHLGEDLVRVIKKLASGGGEIDVTTQAVEQAALEILFE